MTPCHDDRVGNVHSDSVRAGTADIAPLVRGPRKNRLGQDTYSRASFPRGGAGAESRDHCWVGRGQSWLVLGLDKTSRCVLVREGVRIGSAV